MKAKPRSIESFSKDVLASYVKSGFFMADIRKLERIEFEIECRRLTSKVDSLMERSKKLHGIENIKAYLKVSDELTATWAQLDALQKAYYEKIETRCSQ